MSRTLRLRVGSLQYGSPGIVICQAVDDDQANYSDFSHVGGNQVGQPKPPIGQGGLPGSTKLVLIDSVTLRDQDDGPGYYVAVMGFSSGWRGAVIMKSGDNGASYDDVASQTHEAVIGYATSVLPTTSRYEDWDRINTVDIQLLKPNTYSLVSDSEINVLNGSNVGALICANGKVEVFQWS